MTYFLYPTKCLKCLKCTKEWKTIHGREGTVRCPFCKSPEIKKIDAINTIPSTNSEGHAQV